MVAYDISKIFLCKLKLITMCTIRRIPLVTIATASFVYSSRNKAYADTYPFVKSKSSRLSTLLPSYTATYDANNPSEDRAVKHRAIGNWQCAAIFDGHGGWQVSEFASKSIFDHLSRNMIDKNVDLIAEDFINKDTISQLLIDTFAKVEIDYINSVSQTFKLGYGEVAKVGSCALVVLRNNNQLFVANCGDCRAVLATSENSSLIATRLTNDHNAREPAEKEKLVREHPNELDVVVCKSPHACYVKGRLQLTRALGDAYLKYREFNGVPNSHRSSGRHIPEPYTPPYVSHTPEIKPRTLTLQDKFLILATDGVWDFLSDQEAVNIVGSCTDRSQAAETLVQAALQVAAKEAETTLEKMKSLPLGNKRRSLHDDTTTIVLYLDE